MENFTQQYTRTSPFLARIKERFDLCASCPDKNTYHIALDIKGSGITYNVGDCVGVCPVNDPVLVARTLEALSADGSEMITDKRSGEMQTFEAYLKIGANLTDINRKFLKEVAERQTNSAKKDSLEKMLLPEGKEQLKSYLFGRHYWDVLKEHHEVTFTAAEFSECLMPLLPRYYSIASSQAVNPDEVHLTIKVLTYEAHGHERKGVCTHYLCSMTNIEEAVVPLFIHPHKGFTVPEDPTAPMIMIGPGTGVAPFRAFMQERIATGASGKHWLFFGEWRQTHNYLYADYWTELEKQGLLRLSLAFSRDQEEKIYVQHRLLEHGQEIYRWLQEGAYLYVCGDAQYMAKDVEASLKQIIQANGNCSEEEAGAYIKALRKEKRYLRDVY